jgi:uncharacterized integral membrane protein
MILFLLVFGLLVAFIALNLGNSCDISFGFKVFSHVPVFLTAFLAFAGGMLSAIPFSLGRRNKKGRVPKPRKGKNEALPPGTLPPGSGSPSEAPVSQGDGLA